MSSNLGVSSIFAFCGSKSVAASKIPSIFFLNIPWLSLSQPY